MYAQHESGLNSPAPLLFDCVIISMIEGSSNTKMAAQTPGIQQLLIAEKKAAERVAEARKRKYGVFLITKKLRIALNIILNVAI